MKASGTRRLVLVGAGHAHVEVLRRWARQPEPDTHLTLVVDRTASIYSGMVPGFVAGQYREEELSLDARGLARAAGAQLVVQAATSIEARQRRVLLEDGSAVDYDLASLDVGSSVAGTDTPGVREFALPSRPMAALIAGVERVVAEAAKAPAGSPLHLLVVGAGAAGVELGLCLEARLRRLGADAQLTLLDRGHHLLPGAPPGLVRRVEEAMRRRRVGLALDAPVRRVEPSCVVLEDGTKVEGDCVLWVTGPAPQALLRHTDLALDAQGFIRIRPTLQVEGVDDVFAVGDCASLPGMVKAGVYAVRSGPILTRNLRRRLRGETLSIFSPQSEFLSLLNLGDGRAVGVKWGVAFEGRWVMALKDRIDRRFMERYR